MKNVFIAAVLSLGIASCNSNESSSTDTATDTTTTTMDNVSSTSGTATDAMNNTGDTAGTGTATTGNTSGTMMSADSATTQFISKAASGSMMEVELGNIARDKASNQRVKDFASMMVTDHTAASNELKSVAGNLVPSSMMPEHRAHIDMMKNKSGASFDKEYMKMMVDDHKKDISEFRKASTGLTNDAVKNFATRTLPVLQKHLDSAQAISKKM